MPSMLVGLTSGTSSSHRDYIYLLAFGYEFHIHVIRYVLFLGIFMDDAAWFCVLFAGYHKD